MSAYCELVSVALLVQLGHDDPSWTSNLGLSGLLVSRRALQKMGMSPSTLGVAACGQ